MNFFIEVVKSIIFLTFPMFVYFYFDSLNIKSNLALFQKISIIASVLLYTAFIDNIYLIIFINIPLFISYIKNYKGTYILISFIIFLYLLFKINLSVYLIILEYVIIFIFLNFVKNKFNIFITIVSYFYTFSLCYYNKISFINNELIFIFFFIIINYFLTLLIKNLMQYSKEEYISLESMYRSYLFKFIHEVKNPIAVCKGYLEIINSKKNKTMKDIDNYVQIIDKEINESLNIMEEYLIFGRYSVNLDYMDFNLLLEDVKNTIKTSLDDKQIDLIFNYNDEELIILGDYNKLKQVLINLIKNSIEAKKENKKLKVNINIHKKKDDIKLEIIDNGIGINDINKIGKEFYTTKISGTGLGVNFSKSIISMHNGTLKYFSSYNEGTKVIINLPLVEM